MGVSYRQSCKNKEKMWNSMIGPHKDSIHLPFCWSVKKVGNVLTFRELPFLRFSSSFYFQFFNFNFTKLEPPFFRIFLFLSKTFLFRIFLLIYSFMFGNNSSLKLKNWNRRALIRVNRTGKMKIVFFSKQSFDLCRKFSFGYLNFVLQNQDKTRKKK